MYKPRKMFMHTRQEICNKLIRPSNLTSGGVETMFLSDRLEPWLELFRPISHNVSTRVFYWPDVAI